jgi:fructose-1,6-bisphosphatase
MVISGDSNLSSALQRCVDKFRGSTFTSGCLVGDLHMLLQTGGLLVAESAHLLCEAAPVALVIEQAGGVAVDQFGNRILGLAIEEDHNAEVTMVVGSRLAITHLQLGSGTGNGHSKLQVDFPDD